MAVKEKKTYNKVSLGGEKYTWADGAIRVGKNENSPGYLLDVILLKTKIGDYVWHKKNISFRGKGKHLDIDCIPYTVRPAEEPVQYSIEDAIDSHFGLATNEHILKGEDKHTPQEVKDITENPL